MRERIEDLGRLQEKLSNIMEAKLFESGFLQYVENENWQDKIDQIAMEIEIIKDQIDNCWDISCGFDFLNEEPATCDCKDCD